MGQATSLNNPGGLVVDDVITNIISHSSIEPTTVRIFQDGRELDFEFNLKELPPVAGPTGPTGPTGAAGAASTVAGPTGPTGPANPTATAVAVTDTTFTPQDFYLTFTDAAGSGQTMRLDSSQLIYNPHVNTVTVAQLNGNAATATSATTATNLAGGAAGRVPFQTASGLTSFTGTGTAGQVLTSTGTGAGWATPAFFTASRSGLSLSTTAAEVLWTNFDQGGGWIGGGGSSQIFTPAGAGSAYYLFDLSLSTSSPCTIIADIRVAGKVVGTLTHGTTSTANHRFMAMRQIGPDSPLEFLLRVTAGTATVNGSPFGTAGESVFLQCVRLT